MNKFVATNQQTKQNVDRQQQIIIKRKLAKF